jgi:hypothetical protein
MSIVGEYFEALIKRERIKMFYIGFLTGFITCLLIVLVIGKHINENGPF